MTPSQIPTALSRRHLLFGAAALGVAGALDPLIGAPAQAAGPATVLPVVARADGCDAPAEAPAGLVRLDITTPAATGVSLLLVRLRVPVAQYLADLAAMSAADGPAATAAAAAVVERDVVNLGGAVVLPGSPVSVWQTLSPGRYHLISYDYTNPDARPVAHRLDVRGDCRRRPVPATDTIRQTPTGFRTPAGPLAAGAAHRLINDSGRLNEAVLIPLAPSATTADVDAFFAALRTGGQPTGSPFIGRPSGSAPLSPGHRAAFRVPLAPGGYLLTSWVVSTSTGLPRAFEGYYRLVTVV